MNLDITVRVVDIVMFLAILAGPIVAVLIAEKRQQRQDALDRRLWIFRTLMSTRSSPLALSHIEALNVVDVEFYSSQSQDKRVVDAWKLYLAHLNDSSYPPDSWGVRKSELLMELLHEMSLALGYSFDKAHIKSGTYYPTGYGDADWDEFEIRKLWIQVLRNQRGICLIPPPTQSDPPSEA